MFNAIDWIVVALIVFFLAFVVKKFSKRVQDAENYYLASRSIPFALLVGTLVATWYGGQGTLNSVEAGAVSGMASWGIWCVGAHLSRIPLALYLAPSVSVRTEMTIPQMIKKSYGPRVAFFIAAYMLIGFLQIGEVVALRNVFSGIFGEDKAQIIVVVVLIGVVALTVFGGMMGVAVTDMMLFWCMCTAVAIAIPAMWSDIGGWTGLVDGLTQQFGAEQAAQLMNPIWGSDMLGVITLLVMSVSVYVDASLYQRFSAADTPRNASRSYLTTFCIFICLDFLLTLAGLMIQVADPTSTNIATSYVNMVCTHLPTGVRALFFVGIVGAIISTLDSMWLVGGMTVANDIIGAFKKLTDRQNVFAARVVIVVISVLGYLCATFFTGSLEATRFINTMAMSITFLVSMTGIFYTGRKSEFSAWATMIVGACVYFFLTFIYPVGFNGMLVALPVGIVTFLITKNFGKDLSIESHV